MLNLSSYWVERITAVGELNNFIDGRSNSHVILHAQIFQTLDQTSLHVAGFGCFNSRVHQALTTRHSVKEKLRGR
jgi:hypothetical protein